MQNRRKPEYDAYEQAGVPPTPSIITHKQQNGIEVKTTTTSSTTSIKKRLYIQPALQKFRFIQLVYHSEISRTECVGRRNSKKKFLKMSVKFHFRQNAQAECCLLTLLFCKERSKAEKRTKKQAYTTIVLVDVAVFIVF